MAYDEIKAMSRTDACFSVRGRDTFFGDREDADKTIEFTALPDGAVEISMSDEVAMGSYNAPMDLTIILTPRQRAWLKEWL